ncbi:mechanosensitive ion channel family protein [Desulfovibrio inopinatus]|uniref:mechanosensitive ion channel family protein n=1 Tax=Desulfovibrio inopinatus TaxID=102109 RepID=UPI00146FB93B|nr:mechanosensitive ion channel family protein [Desulfovibrio inopinatus]
MKAFSESGYRNAPTIEYNERAARTLDLSDIPQSLREDVGYETVLLLKEVLDRIPLPDPATIPDRKAMRIAKETMWRLPETDIVIEKMETGPYKGKYLFSTETVADAETFYSRVKHLPKITGKNEAGYEYYIYSPGWMIPRKFIDALPPWAKNSFHDQAIWQWTGLAASLIVGIGLIWLIFKATRARHALEQEAVRALWIRLLFPICGAAIAYSVNYFIDEQINITGAVLAGTTMALKASTFFFAVWGILIASNILTWTALHAPGVRPQGIDADLIRLVIRLISLVLVFFVCYRAADYFGLPVTAVFASAGIAGVAVALAAREMLANFFGGISIFVDRPFRTGDYIVLDKGERGEVMQVGMRSTRIKTRDDVMITVPNSVITNVKIVNESAPIPQYRVRVKIGVAYGSDIDHVQSLLLNIAHSSDLVAQNPEPRVRFRVFGDSSLDFELLCWAKKPQDRGRLLHELNCTIYKTFHTEGIVIPFPQREVHLISASENNA